MQVFESFHKDLAVNTHRTTLAVSGHKLIPATVEYLLLNSANFITELAALETTVWRVAWPTRLQNLAIPDQQVFCDVTMH